MCHSVCDRDGSGITMIGPLQIRHRLHPFATASPVILWIELGGKPKWLPLDIGYNDEMRTGPIAWVSSVYTVSWGQVAQQTLAATMANYS